MTKALKYALARLREPSTIAGLGVLATLAGLPPGTVDLAAQVVAGLAGLVAVLKPEQGAK
jgi:hypothetical protein